MDSPHENRTVVLRTATLKSAHVDVVGVVGEAGEVRLVAISVLRSLLSEPIKSDAPLGQ